MTQEPQNEQRIHLSDLSLKQKFEGKVVKTELYGAFVDFGAEKDGLIHISQLSNHRVNSVTDVVHEGDTVTVWIHSLDTQQGRIGLTMVEPPERSMRDLQPNTTVTGTVTKLTPYGAFVDVGVGRDGLLHISEMAEERVAKASDIVREGQEIQVRVVKVDHNKRQIELSLKGLNSAAQLEEEPVEGDEDELSPMTAMELAWRNAMAGQGQSLKVTAQSKGRRPNREQVRRQQVAIITRTLKGRQD